MRPISNILMSISNSSILRTTFMQLMIIKLRSYRLGSRYRNQSAIGLLIHHEQDHKPMMLWLTLQPVFLDETTAMRPEVAV